MSKSGWLPMRTAPRDGTMINVACLGNGEEGSEFVVQACYMASGPEGTGKGDEDADWWGVTPSRWSSEAGELPKRWKALHITPVCWMPLPQPESHAKLRRRLSQLLAHKYNKATP